MENQAMSTKTKQTGDKSSKAGPPLLKPLPNGVLEHRGTYTEGIPRNLCGGIVGLGDGTLMLAYADHLRLKRGAAVASKSRISVDGGKTWKPPQLFCKFGINGMIRLKSGKLAAYGDKNYGDKGVHFSSSPDDGKTWTTPVDIGAYQNFSPYLHSMSQLSSGRILLAGYCYMNAGQPDEQDLAGASDAIPYYQYAWGLWRGRVLFCEGHRGPEMGIIIVYYSDDEGLTWEQCKGGLFGWFDEKGEPNGQGGIIDVYEPTLAETKDGRVMMIMRSKTGRLLQSYSLDQGETWLSVLPSELAASQTSPQLIRIPETGDMLCVWNQVSGEEIRRGFQRGRLSSAISRDNGLSWEKFKTLELQEGMEDVAHILPEFPIARRVVGRPGLGQLPDGFIMFTQPTVDIVGDLVFIRYGRAWPVEKELPDTQQTSGKWPTMWPRLEDGGAEMQGNELVMRIYPLKWLYK